MICKTGDLFLHNCRSCVRYVNCCKQPNICICMGSAGMSCKCTVCYVLLLNALCKLLVIVPLRGCAVFSICPCTLFFRPTVGETVLDISGHLTVLYCCHHALVQVFTSQVSFYCRILHVQQNWRKLNV